MPFIKLKTNLASQNFGNDRPGGGSSKEPYQRFPTNGFQISSNSTNSIYFSNRFVDVSTNSFIPQNFLELYEATRNSSDFPIRGGNLDFDIRTQTVTRFGKIDRERIQKFLKDKPRGTTFLLKQTGLQLSNPKIQVGKTIQGVSDFNLIENTRVFNGGVNLLAQVGVAGTGTHFMRHGLVPYNPLEKTYEKTVVGQSNETNRLIALKQLKIDGAPNGYTDYGVSRESRISAANLGLSYNSNILVQYLGGPGSVYGVGTTTVRRYENTTLATTKRLPSYSTRDYDRLRSTSLNDFYGVGNPGVSNENIFPGGKPGYANQNSAFSNQFKSESKDVLNASDPMYFANSTQPWNVESDNHKDIIKFVFECINNDKPDRSIALFFRAFLSGISDNHQAAINSFRYFGRGEEFYAYQGVSRAISFSFKIAAQSKEEMRPLYNKLNYLISQTYPDYSQKGVMRAPLMRLTIGDYFYRVAGLLDNINITIEDNVPWEINFEKDDNTRQLPQVISVQCSFKPIQDFLPRRGSVDELGRVNSPSYITEQESEVPNRDMYINKNTDRKTADVATVQQTSNRESVIPGVTDISTENAYFNSVDARIRNTRINLQPLSYEQQFLNRLSNFGTPFNR